MSLVQSTTSHRRLSLGYESQSAFSTAFKWVMGCSARQYSRGRNPASPSHWYQQARLSHVARLANCRLNGVTGKKSLFRIERTVCE
jgi:hypothetical protein